MSVSTRDPVVTQGQRLPWSTHTRHAQPRPPLDAVLESWRRLIPEATMLTFSPVLPLGMDAQRARETLLNRVDTWLDLPQWFEHTCLAFDATATGTAADFCATLSGSAKRAGLGLVLDLPTPSRITESTRGLCESPDVLRRLAPHLRPQITPTLTLATRWLRSRDDAQWAIEQGMPVRLVPGGDADPRQPQRDPGAGVRVLARHIAGKVPHVTVAWPDPGAALEVLRLLRKAGTACDLEVSPDRPLGALRQVARSAGVPARVHGRWSPLTHRISTPHSDVRPQ